MKKLLSMVLTASMLLSLTSCGAGTKYDNVDLNQSSEKNLEAIETFVSDGLREQGYFPVHENTTIKWIGYSHFAEKNMSLEDFESTQMGGYYKYEAFDVGGDLITGAVTCYWGEGEEPVIQYMKVFKNGPITEENVLIEYTDEKDRACWEKYQEMCEE